MRMTKSTYVRARGDRAYFWDIRTDVPNRRVTTIAGRAGTRGRKTVRRFGSYDEVREHVERAVERQLALGFEQVA